MPTRTRVFITEYFYRGVWHSSVGCRFFCAERINIWVGALTRVREKKKKKESWSGWATRCNCCRKGGQTYSQHPQTVVLTCATHGFAHFIRASCCRKYTWRYVSRRTPTTSPSARHLGQRRTHKDVLFLFWLTYTSAWKYTPLALLFKHISCVRAIYVCKIVAARRPPRLSAQQRWIVARRQ